MEEIVKKLESWGINGVENYIVVMFVCSLFILLASFIDMWSGIDAAKANKEHIDSKGLRRTVNKAIDYFRVLLFGAMIDALGLFFSWYVAPYAMILVTVGIIVIEGAYSLSPAFGHYYDLSVFCDVDGSVQMRRIIARNGKEKAEVFRTRWIPMEELYISSCAIMEKADRIIRCCQEMGGSIPS